MIKSVFKVVEEINERYSEFITVDACSIGVEGLTFDTFSLDDVADETYYYYDRFNYSIKKDKIR